MMKAFAYRSAKTVEEAVGALADKWGSVEVLAGGTDLLSIMKEGLVAPERVVNIKEIAALGGIAEVDGAIRLGATATLAEIAGNALVRRALPALVDSIKDLGGPQIRNMGTLGGNLCQRSRDWYFRNNLQVPVKDQEETQYAAIFPADGAIYVHPSGLAPALIAYGATVHLSGGITMPLENFFQVSNMADKRETMLKPNQIVTGVTIPVTEGCKSAAYEVRERQSHDWPLVQAAVAIKMDGDMVKAAHIILGHVGPLPVRAQAAEQAIVGKTLNEQTAAAAGRAAIHGAKSLGKNEYKVTLTQVVVKRALLAAIGNLYWRS